MGPRYSGRSWFGAPATATSSRGFASASTSGIRSGTGRARAHMECAPARGAELPHRSGRPHVGRRTDRAPRRAERSIVGPVRCRGAARADVGLAGSGAIPVRAAARTLLGRQQTGHPGSVHAGPVVGLARNRLQAAGFRVGRRACAGFVGCPRRFRPERSPGRSAVLERAGRARMGYSQDPGAGRPGRAIVVGPVGRAGATACTAAPDGANAATAGGPCSRLVAARRVSRPAEVPRASHGGIARRGGLATGRSSGAGPSALAVARGDGPTRNAVPSGPVGARRGRHDNRAGRCRRSRCSRSGRCARRHRPHARMAATTAGGASGPSRRAGYRRPDTAAHWRRRSTGRADDRVRP